MGEPTDSHPDSPVDHLSTEPKRVHSTCVIVLGVALVSAVLDVGALALLLGPDLMAPVHQIRGMAYYEQGDLDRPITAFDRVIELQPDYASAYSNRRMAYHGKGDPARAMQDYNRAIALQPDFSGASSQRGLHGGCPTCPVQRRRWVHGQLVGSRGSSNPGDRNRSGRACGDWPDTHGDFSNSGGGNTPSDLGGPDTRCAVSAAHNGGIHLRQSGARIQARSSAQDRALRACSDQAEPLLGELEGD